MRVLVTRPEPDGERTAAALRARGHAVLLAPLMRIETLPAAIDAGSFAAILITSTNAVRAIAGHARLQEFIALPVLAVGERSAQAARAAGFRDVSAAGGDVDGLAQLAKSRGAALGPLLYLAGEDRAGDLAGALAQHGFTVQTAVIYRAAEADFPIAASHELARGSIDGVLHFSRRSAALFLAAATKAGQRAAALALVHHCLSHQVAAPLAEAGAKTIRIAARPDEDALLALLDC